ncbi:MAG: hypothetical protein CMB38_01355 [Euryarchaeota archaeon]|nr:hypothetical protein [Euryarchaeota archaeon]DAC36196.1 MAG TPA: DUF655 domain-containing protein [Candidatus Poseidoniales archaeon]
MSSPGRDRRVNIPNRKAKDTSSPTSWKAPAYGRPQPAPKAQPEPRQQRAPRQQRQPRKDGGGGRGRQQRPRAPQGLPKDHPLRASSWARVVEHDLGDKVLVVVAEQDGTLGRVGTVENAEFQAVGERVYIGEDRSKRTVVDRLLGFAKVERLSPTAREQVSTALSELVSANANHFLKGFYNVAGPINRKTHAFQLLNGVGPKKAEEMVEARASAGGFATFEALNEACGIDGASALAHRFAEELLDRNLQPRLVEMLLPVKA